MKKRLSIIISIFILFMTVSMLITLNQTRGLIQDGYENDLRVESRMIANSIDNSFLRPLTVSETMSKDKPLREILMSETREETIQKENSAAQYLQTIKDGFGYSMVFAVNDKYGTYYTYDGITKFIDIENNIHDEWYAVFINREGDKSYKMDVDTDETNNWSLSVFINTEVKDNDGNYIGCCGVGVQMTELQRLIERYERVYDVKVNLINEDGLIQIDTDAQRIERDYIDIENLTQYSDGECYYEISKEKARSIIYLDSLEWYLIVESATAVNQGVFAIILPNIVCMVLGIALLSVLMMVYRWYK